MKGNTGAGMGALFVLAMMLIGSPAIPSDTPPLGQGSTASLTEQEVALLGSLDTAHAMMQLEYISGLGEKVAGDAAERGAQQYVYDTLRGMPVDEVVMETFPTTSWGHEGDFVRIVSPQAESLPASIYGYAYGIWGRWFGKPYSFGNTNNDRVLRAPVVDVGYGTAAEFEAVGDLNGAIALVRRDDNLQVWPNTMTEEAALHGASAIINYGYYGDVVHPDGIKQDVSGGPLPEFAISVNSAARIQSLLQQGPVVLELGGGPTRSPRRSASPSTSRPTCTARRARMSTSSLPATSTAGGSARATTAPPSRRCWSSPGHSPMPGRWGTSTTTGRSSSSQWAPRSSADPGTPGTTG